MNDGTWNGAQEPAATGHTRKKSQNNGRSPVAAEGDAAQAGADVNLVDARASTTHAKRKNYVSRACSTCRRRKLKCDGAPICSTCQQYSETCDYSAGIDARRPTSKNHVAALQERIAVLEALVLELQGQLPPAHKQQSQTAFVAPDRKSLAPDAAAYAAPNQDNRPGKPVRKTTSEHQDYSALLHDVGLDRLKLDPNSHELVQYGPTSAFRHAVNMDSSVKARLTSPESTASAVSNEFQEDGRIWLKSFPAGLEDWDDNLHAALLELFFRHHNDFYCFVDEAAFRADMETCLSPSASGRPSPPTRTSSYSALLHCGMMMQAGWLSTDPRTDEDSLELFLQHAVNLITIEGDRPMLSTLQGLLLLGNGYTCCGRPGLGYLFGGVAIRMSTTLGLGVDCSAYVRNGVLTKQAQEARVRTQWACFLMDKLWSSYVGRTPTLPPGEITIPAIDPAIDALPWKTSSNILKPIPGWVSSTHHNKIKLTLLQDRVMHAVYDIRTDLYATSTLMTVTEINLALEEWMAHLPDHIRIMPQTTTPPPPHVTILNMFYHFVVILLHRPYYFPRKNLKEASVNEAAFKRCNSSAARIVSLLNLFARSPGLPMSPIILVQFAFVAGTTHLLALANAEAQRSSKRATDARKNVAVCISILSALGQTCRTGLLCSDILVKMQNDWSLNGGVQQEYRAAVPQDESEQQPSIMSDGSDASSTERTDLANAGGLFSAPVPPTALGYLRLQPLPGIDESSNTSAQIEGLLKRSFGNFATLNPGHIAAAQPFNSTFSTTAPMWLSTPSSASAPLPFDLSLHPIPMLAKSGLTNTASASGDTTWSFSVPQMTTIPGNRTNTFGQTLLNQTIEEQTPVWPALPDKTSGSALQAPASHNYSQQSFNPAGAFSLSSFALGPSQALHHVPLNSVYPSGTEAGAYSGTSENLQPPSIDVAPAKNSSPSTYTIHSPLNSGPSQNFDFNTWLSSYADVPGMERLDMSTSSHNVDELMAYTTPSMMTTNRTRQWPEDSWYNSPS